MSRNLTKFFNLEVGTIWYINLEVSDRLWGLLITTHSFIRNQVGIDCNMEENSMTIRYDREVRVSRYLEMSSLLLGNNAGELSFHPLNVALV